MQRLEFEVWDKLEPEAQDYIRHLHELLWRVARVVWPGASGSLDNYIPEAIEVLEQRADRK